MYNTNNFSISQPCILFISPPGFWSNKNTGGNKELGNVQKCGNVLLHTFFDDEVIELLQLENAVLKELHHQPCPNALPTTQNNKFNSYKPF